MRFHSCENGRNDRCNAQRARVALMNRMRGGNGSVRVTRDRYSSRENGDGRLGNTLLDNSTPDMVAGNSEFVQLPSLAKLIEQWVETFGMTQSHV